MQENTISRFPFTARMKDLPESFRPCEKCEACGAYALSDAELLAVILRTGTPGRNATAVAEDILSLHHSENGLLNLTHYGLSDFMSVDGIGKVKAMQLVCLGELSRRIWKQQAVRHLDVHRPSTVADYYREDLRHLDYECVYLMLLDRRDTLRKSLCVSRGSMHGSAISPREIFKAAIAHQACGVIVVHNHPSGDPTPSCDDGRLTDRLYHAGLEIGIPLLDHIIIGDGRYFSFCEERMLNGSAAELLGAAQP